MGTSGDLYERLACDLPCPTGGNGRSGLGLRHYVCVTDAGTSGLMRVFRIHDSDADVPRLLDRVRTAVVELGSVHVYDISFCAHHDGLDDVAEMTVYYWPNDEPNGGG